ncbi:MAG TPA: hypothetical protein VGF30_06785 [Bacteroidia bacterium]
MNTVKRKQKQENIIERLVEIGGAFGRMIKDHCDDEANVHLIILDCASQCTSPEALDLFGEDLIIDMLQYKKEFHS